MRLPWSKPQPVVVVGGTGTPEQEQRAAERQQALAEVREALEKVEEQNSGIVRTAHGFAILLIVATSVASLISLGRDLVSKLSWPPTRDSIPVMCGVAILLILVTAMDVGSLYAAAQVRVLSGRQAEGKEIAQHWAVMLLVSALEAGTYIYMMFLYETPHNLVTGVLVVARGLAVPVLALYLATARPMTVTPADIAHQSGLITGKAVLNDLITLATDPNAATPQLARKIAMYLAAAPLSEKEKVRLRNMYRAATDEVVDIDALLGLPPQPQSFAALPPPTSGQQETGDNGVDGTEEGSLTPEQADQLRARIIREGYPLGDQDRAMNERLRRSLLTQTRRSQLKHLTNMSDAQLEGRLKELFPNRVKVKEEARS
jgi:hypothetical protein